MEEKKRIIILGLSGSIGRQALDVLDLSGGFEIVGASVDKSIGFLEEQIKSRSIFHACVGEKGVADALKARLGAKHKIYFGVDGMCEMIRELSPDIVLNALGGMVGLRPTLAAIESGCAVALANKETLVAGGELVMAQAKKYGAEILPVDSEHSAIWQALRSGKSKELEKIILTASGGPFFNYSKEQLLTVTRDDALKHPNWNMGRKITIDSATMMNKGLEVIEAMHLFNIPVGKIEVVLHRQSIVHSAVEFIDGSIIAQLGAPDMRLPISYALNFPTRMPSPAKKLSLSDVGELTFFKPDEERFPCLRIAKLCAAKLGTATTSLNGANEAAVGLFLDGKIGFMDIPRLVEKAVESHVYIKKPDLGDILSADREARRLVIESVNRA